MKNKKTKKDIKNCVSVFIDYNPLNKQLNDITKINEVLKAYEKRYK